jgi:hypothetical protein
MYYYVKKKFIKNLKYKVSRINYFDKKISYKSDDLDLNTKLTK